MSEPIIDPLQIAIAGLRALASREVDPRSADGTEMKQLAQETLDAIGAAMGPVGKAGADVRSAVRSFLG